MASRWAASVAEVSVPLCAFGGCGEMKVVGGDRGMMLGGFKSVGGVLCMGVCMRCKYQCVAGLWQGLTGSREVSRAVFVNASCGTIGFGSEGLFSQACGGGDALSSALSPSDLYG